MSDGPKRILNVLVQMITGGIETFVMNLYRNIDKNKVQFDFLICSGHCDFRDEIISLGGKVHNIRGYKESMSGYMHDINEFFSNHKEYDTAHIHGSGQSSVMAARYAKKNGMKRIILHSHGSGSPGRSLTSKILRIYNMSRIKKYATHYFACSDLAAKWLFGNYIDRSEIEIINNGIEVGKFIYKKEIRQKLRSELDLTDKFVIGHAGGFLRVKNHSFLLDVFAEVQKKNPNAMLMLVGDGELRGEIEKKIEKLNLKDHVILTGIRSDVNDLMQAMDVFLFPSLNEGLGVVLIEAQASGLHCITSAGVVPTGARVTSLLEYVSLNQTPAYWAEQALKYDDGYERRDMSGEIKKAGFDIKDLTEQVENFYENGKL